MALLLGVLAEGLGHSQALNHELAPVQRSASHMTRLVYSSFATHRPAYEYFQSTQTVTYISVYRG
ncbi:hypothetical protein PISMIDRAFT_685733 [Pisolithus microcarpus 441]|uniref:Uncharacterized protein n=1 Tax=Pisolithus microcarpus 441 TaxID=765257 RepID=A0A0C9YSV4_9AGAM|nr:hypothetical protein PISMIDRAFT_685733 [Pisolithus microcarpus 441]